MKDMGIKSLEGRRVLAAKINDDKDIVIFETPEGPLYLSWSGDCCANCFLAAVSGSENLVDATIILATDSEWENFKRDEDGCDVVESMGTKFTTSKGLVDFESRVEHNGYYGGVLKVSDVAPIDNYSSPRDVVPGEFRSLEDFS